MLSVQDARCLVADQAEEKLSRDHAASIEREIRTAAGAGLHELVLHAPAGGPEGRLARKWVIAARAELVRSGFQVDEIHSGGLRMLKVRW
jgi:hypothetical protein